MSKNKSDKSVNYNNGLIDGVMSCEEEERKLQHNNGPKSKLSTGGMFKFPDLNE